MSSLRRVVATFVGVTPVRSSTRRGVVLSFEPARLRLEIDRIDDFAELGPELTVAAVAGLGKVIRILRAARLAGPKDPRELLGQEERAAALLERARQTVLQLALRPRTRLRFVAWTESGMESVEDVVEVLESPEAYYVIRRAGRYPVRVARDAVVRHRTELERWYEVVSIERA